MTLGNASKAGKARFDRCVASDGNYFKGQRRRHKNLLIFFFF